MIHAELKSIDINGDLYHYIVYCTVTEVGDYYGTVFFKTYKTIIRKMWIFWGTEYETIIPNKLFELSFDIEDPSITRSELRGILERKVELLNREKEIKEGKLI